MRVRDKHTVLIPDRRGNNRVDTLRNLVRDPRISLLFMIPGIGNTLRINGRAEISVDPELCASFDMHGKVPKCVVVVTAERVYTQCPKALVRSRLWSPDSLVDRSRAAERGRDDGRRSARAPSTPPSTTRPTRSGSRRRSTEAERRVAEQLGRHRHMALVG